MPNHFRLLFQAITPKSTALDQLIIIPAKGMAHERQVPTAARLGLPDMRHFMDEETLQRQTFIGKVAGPVRTVGVKMNISGWRHDNTAWLKRPPFAPDDPYFGVIDCITEHRSGQLDFAGSQGTR